MKNDLFGSKLGAKGRPFLLLIIGLLFHALPLHAQTSGTIWWAHGGSIDAATIYAISVKDGTGYVEMEYEGEKQWFSGLLSVQFNEDGAPRPADGSQYPQMGNLVSEATSTVQPTPTLTIHERYKAIQRRQIEQAKRLAAERQAGEYSQSEETAADTAGEAMDRIVTELTGRTPIPKSTPTRTPWPTTPPRPTTPLTVLTGVAPHRLNDTWIHPHGDLVWLFIVGEPGLSETEARSIIEMYDRKYPRAVVLNISIFCDDTYAANRYVDDPTVSDKEFYAHVLYDYARADGKRQFFSPSNPRRTGQGSACK